jgi:hypothetical protein
MRGIAIKAGALALCLVSAGASSAWAAPTIIRTTVSKVDTDSATLLAEINPQGQEGTFRFEYGPEDCPKSSCTQVPVPEGKLEANTSAETVQAHAEGLTPGTTYHLRVVATTPGGTEAGPDRLFSTYVSAFDGLPDGRAYEQASPVKKNAADARGTVPWVKAADDGSAVGFLSTSGIPDGVGEQEVPAYLSSRSTTNWSTQGLLPPAAFGSEAYLLGWLPDLSSVFDLAREFAAGKDGVFLARSSADGSLQPIVSHGDGLFNLPSYAGSSADGSKIIFEASAKLPCCEKALTGESNVYLWDRDSDKISLVSVLNDDNPPASGAVVGPYDWMQMPNLPLLAGQGGSASGYYTQDTHAITADGGVYFTASGSGALFERINPTAEQSLLDEGKCSEPEKACTIEVSASRRQPPDPLGSRPAAFMAASPDGQSTFFASPEELTGDANTGPLQPPPAIERATVGGSPIKPSFPITAGGVATDAEYIYWANPLEHAIGRAKLDGTDVKPVFIPIPKLKFKNSQEKVVSVPANPQYVAVDGEHVYWTNEAEGEKREHVTGQGSIGRAKIEGDPESIEAEWITGATQPQGIAVDANYVYWANAGEGLIEGTIGRAEIEGGDIKQSFVPGNGTEAPQGVAVDGGHVYWSTIDPNGNGGLIRRVELDGSNMIVRGARPQPRGVAVDANYVYWASQGEEAIGRMPIAGFAESGPCEEIVSCEPNFIPTTGKPKGLANNATNLYWSVNGETTPNPGNDLYLYRSGDESLRDLTADPVDPNGAEVKGVLGASQDAKRVYFAANGDLDGAGKAQAGDCRGELSSVFVFSGQCSLYLAEETAPGSWSTSFVARLNASGGIEQSDARNWQGRGGGADRRQKSALVSADGATLLFRSQEQLGEYDNEGQPELYRYEAAARSLSCVSCNPSGEAPIGSARLGSIGVSSFEPPTDPALVLSRNLSADGKRVFFETTDPLVVDDANGRSKCDIEGPPNTRVPSCLDVYEWEAQGTGSCKEDVQGGGCLYLLSTGTSPNASFFADASLNGDDAFLVTRSAGLVGQDQDQLQDVYDTRVGGGLESQRQVVVPECESLDGCHRPQSPAPGFESPTSAGLAGPDNEKHARHGAKKHHKHKKHHKRKRAAQKRVGKSR